MAQLRIDKDPAFHVHSDFPYNGEPPLAKLVETFLTPNPLFYVRNHGTIPLLDVHSYRLHVGGLVGKPLELSLADLQRNFTHTTITATLECAGNRRTEMIAVKPIPGEVPWISGAIGTAEWGGVPLCEVLEAALVERPARHVSFVGLDEIQKDERNLHFGGSIPIEKALRPEVLLAYEMNGAPLAPVHGHPLRLVVPGYIGARSVKWLAEITAQAEPSSNYYYAQGYRLFPPGATAESVQAPTGIPLGELNVSSAIHLAGPDQLRGYAFTGGDRTIEWVEITTDAGHTWQTAELPGNPQPFTWRLWQAALGTHAGPVQAAVRAWDSAANTQPESAEAIWNLKGYLNNAWQRIDISTV